MTHEIDEDRLLSRLADMEGFERLPYRDSKNILTIGVGHNLAVPLSDAAIRQILADDVAHAGEALDRFCPWWADLDPVRREVMLELMFNMGWGDGKRGLSTFTRTLSAVRSGDYERAAAGLATSKWAKDVGQRRSDGVVRAMRTGSWE